MTVVYMTVQFIGAGLVAGALLDVDFTVAVLILGGLMTLYTVLGGMVAATYIQIFKTSLLAVMVLAVFVAVIKRTGWNPIGPMLDATDNLGDKVVTPDRSDMTASINSLSLTIGLTLGIMGLPHVMLRFLTVRDARAARNSAAVAISIFMVFFLMLPIFGYAALNEIGKKAIVAANPAGNSAGPMLAEKVGGDVLYALVAGVTITTILAVLAGMAIAVSGAVAHDLYTNVAKKGHVDERGQLISGRIAGALSAAVAILLALGAKNLNIANVANIAFAIAASTTMPTLLLTLYWRRFNQVGALCSMIGGLIVSLGLVLLGPDVMGKDAAIWPLAIPAIVSVPASFLFAYLGTLIGAGRVGSTGMPYDEFERPARSRRTRPLRAAASPAGLVSPSGWAPREGRRARLSRARRRGPAAGRDVPRPGGARPHRRARADAGRQGGARDRAGASCSRDVLADPDAGAHLVDSMLRPTPEALERLDELPRHRASPTSAPRTVRREGRAGVARAAQPAPPQRRGRHARCRPPRSRSTSLLLDPEIEIGVLRGGVVEHPRYAGRRIFGAGHQPHAPLPRPDLLPVLPGPRPRLRQQDLPRPARPRARHAEKLWIAAAETYAIGGACQLLHVIDHVIAERGCRLYLPARKEGIIPGAANLRLPRFVGDRLRPPGDPLRPRVRGRHAGGDLAATRSSSPGRWTRRSSARVEALTSSGLVNARRQPARAARRRRSRSTSSASTWPSTRASRRSATSARR